MKKDDENMVYGVGCIVVAIAAILFFYALIHAGIETIKLFTK